MALLGIDTGGTFTDFVFYDQGNLRVHKVLSTPDAPELAILQGIKDLGIDVTGMRVVHGSTVATNAVLEGKGVKTAFITNRGFADLLTIGRQARPELYNLQPQSIEPPVPASLCLETGGRISASGEVLDALTDDDIKALVTTVRNLKVKAVAVNLLFSWKDNSAEKRIRDALPDDLFVSLSSQVLPEIREYERGIATWLNAWVGPLVEGYVQRLAKGVARANLSIIQSSGDTVEVSQAAEQAVRMLLSGPAGGLVGASYLGEQSGIMKLLTFDMGGTSTDVALLHGEPQLTNEGKIGRWPVAVSMVDMHTIGAGGGSIATVDLGGMLHVGPESAGADPGPVCYGRGGSIVTVTDANVVLGRLRAEAFLGGEMQLDFDASVRAMQALADKMQIDLMAAAEGIIAVANEHMVQALRMISVQRGVDPSNYTLMCFGGAGGLHVCALAEALNVRQAIVPAHAGVLSALGMLVTRPGREVSHTWQGLMCDITKKTIETQFERLGIEASASLISEGFQHDQLIFEKSLDLRYRGQSYTLNLPWHGVDSTVDAFHDLHLQRYGHSLELPVELLNLRLRVRAPQAELILNQSDQQAPADKAAVLTGPGDDRDVPLYQRDALTDGNCLRGPAVIAEQISTTWIAPGWECRLDAIGNLLLQKY